MGIRVWIWIDREKGIAIELDLVGSWVHGVWVLKEKKRRGKKYGTFDDRIWVRYIVEEGERERVSPELLVEIGLKERSSPWLFNQRRWLKRKGGEDNVEVFIKEKISKIIKDLTKKNHINNTPSINSVRWYVSNKIFGVFCWSKITFRVASWNYPNSWGHISAFFLISIFLKKGFASFFIHVTI